ncbi:MAG: UvrD-helicase domain-containing protein, partial [Deltaproteobacteria bacterium]|nr:UvrD-helicase domain-containing protein [Deltaproteobacteria bacterium]
MSDVVAIDPLAKLLNPPQLQAVRHTEGPLLVLAGAGSGKTRVLVHRLAHLLRSNLARPGEILAVTFTNKAAGELKERVHALVGPGAERLWVSTFHAFGARLLRREADALGLTRSFAIYDDSDQLAAMKRVLSDMNVEAGEAKSLLWRIDRWKNEGLLPPQVKAGEFDVPGQLAVKAYARYQEALQKSDAVDFGDLLVRCLELFQKRPEIADEYAGRFRYVMVDEFQDTNPAQYKLLVELTKMHGNL